MWRSPMAEPVKKKADDAPATDEQLAAVLSDDPETAEEAFAEAFDEFAAQDDTVTADPAAPDGAAKGAEADDKAGAEAPAADKTEAKPASGEKPPDTDEAAPKGAAETDDIWADASPEQKAAFEAAQQENRSHRGRASALARQQTALKALPPAADEAADATRTAEDAENWEKFKDEYPEVAGPMETRFEKRLATLEAENANLKSQVTGITDGQLQDAINDEEALLVQRHPDWEQLTASKDFAAWLPGQPRYVQEGFARNGSVIADGQEAASLIDLFKDDHPVPPQPGDKKPAKETTNQGKATRRARRLESAVSTESGQAGPGAGPPEGDFDAAFDHFAAQP